jgi:Zn-dependent protease
MSETPDEAVKAPTYETDFQQVTALVTAEFQIEESLVEHGVPTYYLKQPQQTKQAFERLLETLEKTSLTATLRKQDGKIVLKIIPKPPTKPSNVLVNWVLLLATIGTTFLTGYVLSTGTISPLISGATFTIAIMAVLGGHEMSHKIAANRNKVESTPPYFIPGPPPIGGVGGIGTFGAVILQKSLPRNRDALFDMGMSGPLIGFLICVVVTVVGLAISPATYQLPEGPFLSVPLIFQLIATGLGQLGIYGPGNLILIHPVAIAAIIGIIVNMIQLLPAGQLDGGHVARSVLGDRVRLILSALSIGFLVYTGFYPMAFLVLFLSLFKHPGPLDDVSPLSKSRKLLIFGLIVIFVLSGWSVSEPAYRLRIDSTLSATPFRICYAGSNYYANSTPWEKELAEGTYDISLEQNFTINTTTYSFLQWQDGNTSLTRTVILDQGVSITANYTVIGG